jgi:hypothetical protein
MTSRLCRIAAALCLAGTALVHAQLYLDGYRTLPGIGPAFLLTAAGGFALAVLLPVSDAGILRLGAAALAVGALAGFALSRTVGVLGFVEHGLTPAPQALLSLLCEVAVLVLLGLSAPFRARLPLPSRDVSAETGDDG